ncbi:MAG: nucleotidyltransferase domain-containing protein [Defluviitaleaceae bacterium]|nr:nucleotidyltransferase domain-containing protein [Defluviitaleaceae bacterium]
MDKASILAGRGFLKNHPDLQNIIYLVLSGSHGYGTNNENSDIDLRGVLIEGPKYLYGLENFEQFEDLPSDTVIYGLKKFVRLCCNANPNALELLGVEDDCIVQMSEKGKILRQNAGLFLSKRVISSFGNYAIAQLRRLQNALCHDSYKEHEQKNHLRNTFNAQLEHFKQTYTTFGPNAITIDIDQKSGELIFDIDLKKYPVKDFVGIYSELHSTAKTYQKLNNRNTKKDEPRLYKHALHLLRLLITGTDILRGNGIITKRKAEHSMLMDIRNGKYSFQEIITLSAEYQKQFDEAAQDTNLPYEPDMDKIEALLLNMYSK